MKITKIRHSSILLQTKEHTIYLDPYLDPMIHRDLPKADLILITNTQYDHGNQQSVSMISTPDTRVYGPRAASDDINLDIIEVGDERSSGSTRFKVVTVNNPQQDSHGYLLESESQLIYYPGDTALLDAVEKCTLLLLPITVGLMDLKSSVEFVRRSGAHYVIPVHYGTHTGDVNDANWFKEAVEQETKTRVILLNDGRSQQL